MIYQKKCCFVVIEEKTHQHSSQTIGFFSKEVVLFFSCDVPLCTNKKVGDLIRFGLYIGEYFA